MSVRIAVLADLDGIIALDRGAAEAPHWNLATYRNLLSPANVAGAVTRRAFVWDAAGLALGFAAGMLLDASGVREGEIENVVVATAARRQGIGQALCDAVVAWCRAANAEQVRLEVRASSGGAIALYEKLGFRTSGQRTAYYRDPIEDAVMLVLALGRP